ncbi:MAG: PPC domain-containing protein, partial [Gemmatimonadaceae bacterium]
MIRILLRRANLVNRRRHLGALTLAGVLLAAACSERGITVPAPAAGTSAPLGAAVVSETSAALSASGGILTGPLTNGGNHSGTISVAGQTDTWTFSATAGQFLIVSMGEVSGSVDFTPWLRLKDPNGTIIANALNPAAAQIAITAPLTGTYTVLAATNDQGFNDTGTYRLMAAQLQGNFIVSPGDEGGPLTNGANHPGSILIGDVDLWSISATQGDAIVVAIGEVTGSADYAPWIRVIAPNGTVIANVSNVAAAQTQVAAAATGIYTVVVSTNDPGNDGNGTYSITLAKAPGAITISPGDQGGPLMSGANHVGTIGVGDLDAWTFTA